MINKNWKWFDFVFVIALFGGMMVNGNYLIQYTSLVSKTVPTVEDIKSSEVKFSLLLANVKMTNKNAQPLIDLIDAKKPDLILAMEVDQWWDEKLKAIKNEYTYTQEKINEEAYGMVLYSKIPIKEIVVDYLQNEKVPSFESILTLANGKEIRFHCIHPVPPTHFEDLPDNKGQKERALKKLGTIIEKRKLPTLVAGDINDVVWSHVDALTGTENILFDVRKGRGFYNSYNAENILMRWPLDHVFVTKEFKLKSIERMPKIGSDHFPIFVELVL